MSVLHEGLGSDVNRLASLFVEICENNRDRRDYTRAEIRRALREVAACFPVYRTYVVAEPKQITNEDRDQINNAVARAKERRPDLDAGLFDFIADVLTLQVSGEFESEFLLRFQQFTSPVMAKGVEDTAFYCFNRMIGMNEVGNNPGRVGLTVSEFHEYCAKMPATHPLTMTTLSTHDTKRSDDVRARLAAITEFAGQWKSALMRWSRKNSLCLLLKSRFLRRVSRISLPSLGRAKGLYCHTCSGRFEQSEPRTDDPFHGIDDTRQDFIRHNYVGLSD